MQRGLAALLVTVVALVAGVAAPAGAQVPGLSATLSVVPPSTPPGGTAQVTAVFQPPTTAEPLTVAILLTGLAGRATLATVSNTSGLSNCVTALQALQVKCDWASGGGGAQTLVVTVNVDAAAALGQGFVQATGGPVGGTQDVLASSTFVIGLEGPTTTTTTTTLAPTTAPTTPTSATVAPTTDAVAPTSAAVEPTSAVATTQPEPLPATGGSDASAFIALVVLAFGAFLLLIARKFRET